MFQNFRLLVASYRVFRDPKRLDEVLEVVTHLSTPETKAELAAFMREQGGEARESLERRNSQRFTLDELRKYGPGTFGHAILQFCEGEGIDPRAFKERPGNSDGDFIINELEATHDVWHVLTGFGTDEASEIGLQAFYLAQYPAMLSLLLMAIANLHALFISPDIYPDLMEKTARGWLMGKKARFLWGADLRARWGRSLESVRREFEIDIAGTGERMGPPVARLLQPEPLAA